MEDFMEIGEIVPLQDGWYLHSPTNMLFRYDEEGNAIDENGDMLLPLWEQGEE